MKVAGLMTRSTWNVGPMDGPPSVGRNWALDPHWRGVDQLIILVRDSQDSEFW